MQVARDVALGVEVGHLRRGSACYAADANSSGGGGKAHDHVADDGRLLAVHRAAGVLKAGENHVLHARVASGVHEVDALLVLDRRVCGAATAHACVPARGRASRERAGWRERTAADEKVCYKKSPVGA